MQAFEPAADPATRLVRIWNELLNEDRAAPPTHFFRAGGDSLAALTLQLRIRGALGVALPTRFVFEHPTFDEVLAEVRRRSDGALDLGPAREPAPVPGPARSPSAPEFSQLVIDRFRPGAHPYLECFLFHVCGPLDETRLRRGIGALVRRHPALRTTFAPGADGSFERVAHADLPAEFVTADLRAGGADEWLGEQGRRGIDLQHGPLVRVALARLGADEFRLLFVIHHIAIDEASVRVLFRELDRLYADEGAPLPPPGAAAPVQHPDAERDVRWWVERLRGAPFGGARPRGAARAPARVRRFVLGPELARAVRDQAAAHGTTSFLLLLTAYAALLARTTDRDDLLIGTPVSLRDRPELEHTVGMFVQVLPVRIDATGAPGFFELLARVRRAFLDLLEHRHAPFEQIAGANGPGRAELFSTVFVYHERPLPVPALAGTRAGALPFAAGPAKWDRQWTIAASADGFDCAIESDPDLPDEADGEYLGERFCVLLRAALADPVAPLSGFDVLGERERGAIERFERGAYCAHEETICTAFAAAVARTPHAAALRAGGATVTYRALDAWSDRVAQRLQECGVSTGALVAVALPRSVETVVAALAALKAGAAYVPLDPRDPPDRLRALLDATAPAAVFARPDDGALFGTRPVLAVGPNDAPPAEPFRPVALGAGDRAYVMFTSGSTGRPKPVEVPHRGVVRLARGADYVPLGPPAAVLHHSPGNFDASTLELWGPLLNGGTVVLLPPGPLDLLEMKRAVDEGGVTALWLTAALFHLAVDELPALFEHPRHVLTGGDVVSAEHVARLLAAHPGLTVVNGYGPTENTTFTTCRVVTRADVGPTGLARPAGIGRPIAGTVVRVLDARGRRAPVGSVGELYCGGAGLALGYYARPEDTAERFVPDPLADGARVYRTGDLARWAPDGALDFLGRADRQVKINGYRIEPGEVEAALCLCPGVRQAAVTDRDDGRAEKRLVAYVVGGPDPPTADALRDFAQRKLPAHMVPAAIVFLDRLPLTANGKLDRDALPEPRRAAPLVTPAPFGVPADPVEAALTAIWGELLGLDRVGADENFFALGGDSLLALQLGLRIERAFRVKLSLSAFVEAPTVAALAALIRQDRPAPSDTLSPLVASGAGPPLFLITGLGGHGISLLPLAERLGAGRPVYALQPPGFYDPVAPRSTVAAVARALVAAAKRVAPAGPYYLGGYSAGAVVAYEMARQLRRAGEPVALLAMIDNYGPGYPRIAPRLVRVALRLARFARRIRAHGWRAAVRGRHATGDLLAEVRRAARGASAWWREELKAYRYEPHDGPVVVVRAAEVPDWPGADFSDPLFGWGELARGGLAVHTVPSSHLSIIKPPSVDVLAAALAPHLRDTPSTGVPNRTGAEPFHTGPPVGEPRGARELVVRDVASADDAVRERGGEGTVARAKP